MPLMRSVLEANLDPAQLSAVIDPTPEVLALACAGSGKSTTLAFRIAWLISHSEPASSILAFTFTDKAADSIKLRVAQALVASSLSPTLLGAMYIGTIHSYCQHLLGDIDAGYRQFEVLDDNRLHLYLMSRYGALGLAELRQSRGSTYFETVKEVANAWKTMNDEMLNLQDVAGADALLGASLFSLSARLAADRFLDFSSMIRLAAEALASNQPEAVRAIGHLRHLLVDEYQDVNPAQEVLIQEVHRRTLTIFAVGDDDQSVYGWRGADVTRILTFRDRYPNCAQHSLSTNYRSTEPIVSTADAFIAGELGPARIAKNPRAEVTRKPRDFRVLWFDARADEASWVADRIQRLLHTEYVERDGTRRGLTPGDFAILMRSTRTSEGTDGPPRHAAYTGELQRRAIDYTLEAGGSVFDRPQVEALRAAFELLRNGSPTREVTRALFATALEPAYPNADFEQLTAVISKWGRLVHAPIEGARRRVYPQLLVHELLEALGLRRTEFDPATMQDMGIFSRMIQDVETVFLSVDSRARFQAILNFLANVADSGYDTSTSGVLRRPDAVTVSTVHKMKGLEFPAVFIVDVEANRFPGTRHQYSGWLPQGLLQPALARGAYRSNPEEEARLFYVAMTRAERYLHVTGSETLPNAVRPRRRSPYALRLQHAEISTDPLLEPPGLTPCPAGRRIDETILPTTYSDIRYFLRCPRDYQFRKGFGFSPPVPELFGFGKAVHTAIEKLHEVFPAEAPSPQEADVVVLGTFHLKHVSPSADPLNRPGPFERARDVATDIARSYVADFSADFRHNRQLEVRFEIPVEKAVITGSIDLMLKEDPAGQILEARVIDFKAIEGGDAPEQNERLHWTELALQVQLYAKAAVDVLGENARTGAVHLLKDNQRVEVRVDAEGIARAVANVEWAVARIIQGDFPMRPHVDKCGACDFSLLCSKRPEDFRSEDLPPAICIPGDVTQLPRALSQFQPDFPQQ